MRVPVTSDPRMVRLAQAGLLPSPATMNLARLLLVMRQQGEVSEAQKGKEDDKG